MFCIHSVYRARSDEFDPETQKAKVYQWIIDDFEISWEVEIATEELGNVLNDLVNKATDPTDPIQLPEKTAKALSDFKSNDTFRVSTIFCAFMAERIRRSFDIRDPKGDIVTEDTKFQILNKAQEPLSDAEISDLGVEWDETFLKFLGYIQDKFANAQPRGKPTADNPFVLGYTISQRDSSTSNSGTTPVYLTPASYGCSLSPKNEFSNGTLNFNILTRRAAHENGRQLDIKGADNKAGIFENNLFANLKTAAKPGVADGILVFAQDIMVRHWLAKEVSPCFQVSANIIGQTITNSLNIGRLDAFEINPSAYIYPSTNQYRWVQEGHSTWTPGSGFLGELEDRIRLTIKQSVTVKYDNKLKHDAATSDANNKNRLQMTLVPLLWFKLESETKSLGGLLKDAASEFTNGIIGGSDKANDWTPATELEMWFNFRYKCTLGTANSNPGTLTVIDEISEHMDGEKFKSYEGKPGENETQPGIWKTSSKKNLAKAVDDVFAAMIELAKKMDSLGPGMEDVFVQAFKSLDKSGVVTHNVGKRTAAFLQNGMTDMVNSMGTNIILPAGDVFMFKGLSSDSSGNISTVINYDTATVSEVKMRDVKGLSFSSGWLKPDQE